MKIKTDSIIFREDLYPRFEPDLKKIQEYSDNIELLPPIIINQNKILIDGYHRLRAIELLKHEECEVNEEKTESENDLYIRSIELNSTHGLQLSMKDKKSVAIKLYDGKNADRLTNALSVSERTFRDWTSNRKKQLDDERNEKIIQLYLKCWTQQRIADEVGVDQKTVTNILDSFRKNGKIAEIPNFQPFIYNIWNTTKLENEAEHFGSFPMIFMENILYYYTGPFDIVFDPFAGGGVTIDACKKWYRRYWVSDIKPIELRRSEINELAIQDDLPNISPKLVFLDPPYWKQAENQYSDIKSDLANMELDEFYDVLNDYIKRLKTKLNDGSYVAIVISPTQWKNNMVYEDHIMKIDKMMCKHKFTEEMRYILPYSTEQYNGNQVTIAKEKKICLAIYRDLVIYRK